MNYKDHDIVWKLEGAGFGTPASYALIIDDDQGDHMPCALDCGNDGCMEWSTVWLIEASNLLQARDRALTGKFAGVAYHVSECQLLPDRPEHSLR